MFSDIDTAVKYSRDDVLRSQGACERQFVFCIWSFMKNVFLHPLDHWKGHGKDLLVICPLPLTCSVPRFSTDENRCFIYTLWFERYCAYSDLSASDSITSTLFMQIKMSLTRCPFFYSKGQLSETLFLGQIAQPISESFQKEQKEGLCWGEHPVIFRQTDFYQWRKKLNATGWFLSGTWY